MTAFDIVSALAIVFVVFLLAALVRFAGSARLSGGGKRPANSNDVYAEMLSVKYDLDAMAFEARRRIDKTRSSRRGATRS